MQNNKINIRTHKAAGILPIVEIDNNIYFILGKERNGEFSDFGGYKNSSETSEETALREFDEESMGVLFNKKKLQKIISTLPRYINKKENYVTFLLKLKYKPEIINTYNILLNRIKQCNNKNKLPICDSGLLEKTEFKLFTIDQILKNKQIRKKFRESFKMLLNKIKND